MSGLPVVTTDTCGMKDVVEDGLTGRRVPPGSPVLLASALRALVDSAPLRQLLGSAARARARTDFTWASVGRIPLDAYRALGPPR